MRVECAHCMPNGFVLTDKIPKKSGWLLEGIQNHLKTHPSHVVWKITTADSNPIEKKEK